MAYLSTSVSSEAFVTTTFALPSLKVAVNPLTQLGSSNLTHGFALSTILSDTPEAISPSLFFEKASRWVAPVGILVFLEMKCEGLLPWSFFGREMMWELLPFLFVSDLPQCRA